MLTSPTWNSIPLVMMTTELREELGNAAKSTHYEDRLDPNQDKCPNKYWEGRQMERTAAINARDLENSQPKWCPDDVWGIIKEFMHQPIVLKITQDMVDINLKSPVAISTVQTHRSILKKLTRINKGIRGSPKKDLQIFYDELNTEWVATKPDIRRRDSPIIILEANGIKAKYFWQFGGAIPAADITNKEKFDGNEECLKSPSPMRLITYASIPCLSRIVFSHLDHYQMY